MEGVCATMSLTITATATPNPNAMKFTLNRTVCEGGSKTFSSAEAAAGDPLAEALFAVPGTRMVFFLNDFITVTKDSSSDWATMQPAIEAAIQSRFA
jgi:hypothetical protein